MKLFGQSWNKFSFLHESNESNLHVLLTRDVSDAASLWKGGRLSRSLHSIVKNRIVSVDTDGSVTDGPLLLCAWRLGAQVRVEPGAVPSERSTAESPNSQEQFLDRVGVCLPLFKVHKVHKGPSLILTDVWTHWWLSEDISLDTNKGFSAAMLRAFMHGSWTFLCAPLRKRNFCQHQTKEKNSIIEQEVSRKISQWYKNRSFRIHYGSLQQKIFSPIIKVNLTPCTSATVFLYVSVILQRTPHHKIQAVAENMAAWFCLFSVMYLKIDLLGQKSLRLGPYFVVCLAIQAHVSFKIWSDFSGVAGFPYDFYWTIFLPSGFVIWCHARNLFVVSVSCSREMDFSPDLKAFFPRWKWGSGRIRVSYLCRESSRLLYSFQNQLACSLRGFSSQIFSIFEVSRELSEHNQAPSVSCYKFVLSSVMLQTQMAWNLRFCSPEDHNDLPQDICLDFPLERWLQSCLNSQVEHQTESFLTNDLQLQISETQCWWFFFLCWNQDGI